jgi:hypothetical protein
MSSNYNGDVLFLLLKADTQANPWIFLTVHMYELITIFVPCCH